MSNELKPCPFCDSEAEAYKREKWYSRAIDIRCSNNSCGAHFVGFSVTGWNTRHIPEGMVAREEMNQKVIDSVSATRKRWARSDQDLDVYVMMPIADLKRCHDTGYWTDAMIKAAQGE